MYGLFRMVRVKFCHIRRVVTLVALWYVIEILTQYDPVSRTPNTVWAAVSFTVDPPDMCRDAFVLSVQLYGADIDAGYSYGVWLYHDIIGLESKCTEGSVEAFACGTVIIPISRRKSIGTTSSLIFISSTSPISLSGFF